MALPREQDPGPPARVGLFGGSFDPPHEGHLAAARAARAAFGLSLTVFVPAAQAPHKQEPPCAAGHHRLAMLRALIAAEQDFVVSDLELRRGGTSFAIDTLRALPAELGLPENVEIHLILGSDNLAGLPSWRSAQALLERVQPIVVHREGDSEARLSRLRELLGPELASKLERGYLRLPPVEANSTQLRAALASGSERLPGLPQAVRAYIAAHGLYRDGP